MDEKKVSETRDKGGVISALCNKRNDMKKEVLEWFKELARKVADDTALPEIHRVTIALRINELLSAEIKSDIVRANMKESKLDMYNFVDKGKDVRPQLSGVYYSGGYAYATDTQILVRHRCDYPTEWEGKIVDKDGNEVAGRHPDYEKVIPDWGELEVMGTLTHTDLKNAVALAKGLDKSVIRFVSASNSEMMSYINTDNIKRLRAYLSAKKAIKVWTRLRTTTRMDGTTAQRYEWIYSKDDTTTLLHTSVVCPTDDEAKIQTITLK